LFVADTTQAAGPGSEAVAKEQHTAHEALAVRPLRRSRLPESSSCSSKSTFRAAPSGFRPIKRNLRLPGSGNGVATSAVRAGFEERFGRAAHREWLNAFWSRYASFEWELLLPKRWPWHLQAIFCAATEVVYAIRFSTVVLARLLRQSRYGALTSRF
jgi:hypothetical protein